MCLKEVLYQVGLISEIFYRQQVQQEMVAKNYSGAAQSFADLAAISSSGALTS